MWYIYTMKYCVCVHVCVCVCDLLCPTLCGLMDCSPPASSVHGIFQQRMLQWIFLTWASNSHLLHLLHWQVCYSRLCHVEGTRKITQISENTKLHQISYAEKERTTSTTMEASLIAQWVNNPPAMQRPQFNSCVRRSTGEGIGYPLQSSWTSLVAQLVKNPSAMQEA